MNLVASNHSRNPAWTESRIHHGISSTVPATSWPASACAVSHSRSVSGRVAEHWIGCWAYAITDKPAGSITASSSVPSSLADRPVAVALPAVSKCTRLGTSTDELPATVWRYDCHAANIRHLADPGGRHGHCGGFRSILSSPPRFNGWPDAAGTAWLSTSDWCTAKDRTEPSIATANARASAHEFPSADASAPNESCRQPARPEHSARSQPRRSALRASINATTVPGSRTTGPAVAGDGCRRYGRVPPLCQREAVPSHSEATRSTPEAGGAAPTHVKRPQAVPTRVTP